MSQPAPPPDVEQWSPSQLPAGVRICHYTSPAGLVGIMEDRCLWASEVGSLNDLSEIHAGRQFIADEVANYLVASPDDPVLKAVHRTLEEIIDGGLTRSGTFVLCASLVDDDAAQWRSYTGSRGGYALHLATDRPLQIVVPSSMTKLPEPGTWEAVWELSVQIERWYPVVYGDRKKKELVVDLLDWARKRHGLAVQQRAAAAGHEDPDEVHDESALADYELMTELVAAVDLAAAVMKPAGFSGEREVRTIVSAPVPESIVQFRADDEQVVRYLRLAVATHPEDAAGPLMRDRRDESGRPVRAVPVTGVTVGPTSRSVDAAVTAESVLRYGGVEDPEVRVSAVPMTWR